MVEPSGSSEQVEPPPVPFKFQGKEQKRINRYRTVQLKKAYEHECGKECYHANSWGQRVRSSLLEEGKM